MIIAGVVLQALIGGAVASALWELIAGGGWDMRALAARALALAFVLWLAFSGPWVVG